MNPDGSIRIGDEVIRGGTTMNPDVGSLMNHFIASRAIEREAENVLEQLRVAVREAGPFAGKDIGDEALENPGRVHDWRNYVPESLRELWPRLSEEARLAVLLTAQPIADSEDWD